MINWIIVTPCTRKVSPRAAFSLMNMESEKSCFTFPWQTVNPRHNQHASILLIKLNASGQLRCFHSTSNFRHCIRAFSAILHWITSYQTMLPTVFCNRRGFEHRVENPEVAGKFFSKVLEISQFFRFGGHCILKNPNLPIRCYSIMGQNMGQTAFCGFAKFYFELFGPKTKEKVLKSYNFRTFYGCGGRTRTYDLRVMSPTSFQLLYSAIFCCALLSACV